MLDLFPYLVELILSKIRKRVDEFFPFKSLPQSSFKVRKSCKRKERKQQGKFLKYGHLLFFL
jgi:hypothetical protein